MYGLIHKAMEQMILQNYGDETWVKVVAQAQVPEDSFMTMQSYDDSITISLAGAISEVLETPIEACLELFGEYWLTEFAPDGYEMLLRASGNNLFDFLENLNNLHDRITTTFMGYVPPSFKLTRKSSSSATLVYMSSRQGFTPFVLGLLKGMQTRFNVDISFDSIEVILVDGGDQATIELTVEPR